MGKSEFIARKMEETEQPTSAVVRPMPTATDAMDGETTAVGANAGMAQVTVAVGAAPTAASSRNTLRVSTGTNAALSLRVSGEMTVNSTDAGYVAAVTPTTGQNGNTNSHMTAATLTPLGEDKINAGASYVTQQKDAKQKKPTAAKERAATSARAKATKKASPKRRNGNTKTGTTKSKGGKQNARVSPHTMDNSSSCSTPTVSCETAVGQTTSNAVLNNESGEAQTRIDIPPSQDNELRKAYLQRVYRQLQITYPSEADATIRRFATHLEMETCRRSANRNDYIAILNQEINRLMQGELANCAGMMGQGSFGPLHQSTPIASRPMQESVQDQQPSVVHSNQEMNFDAGQSNVMNISTSSAQETPTASFMALLSTQSPMRGFDQSSTPTFCHDSQKAAFQFQTSAYPNPSNPAQYPSNMYTTRNQQNATTGTPSSGTSMSGNQRCRDGFSAHPFARPHAAMDRVAFAARCRQYTPDALIDLLWNKTNAILQWQRRVYELESQLRTFQAARAMHQGGMTPVMGSKANALGSQYSHELRQTYGGGVPANSSNDAEAQRASHRHFSRMAQQQQSQQGRSGGQPVYGVSSVSSDQSASTPSRSALRVEANPVGYWEKVRHLKEAYMCPLDFALRALSQHSVAANSTQSAKAKNVQHNISLATSILAECPTNVQPRPLQVLDSIEQFIQNTVVPIVRKLNPQVLAQSVHSSAHPDIPVKTTPVETLKNKTTHVETLKTCLPTDETHAMSTQGGTHSPKLSSTGPLHHSQAANSQDSSAPTPLATASNKSSAKKATSSKTSSQKKAPSGKKGSTAAKNHPKLTSKKGPQRSKIPVQQSIPSGSDTSVPSPSFSAQQIPQSVGAFHFPDTPQAGYNGGNNQGDQPAALKETIVCDDSNLNDFPDFPELDFEELQETVSKAEYNKENSSDSNARKRSIEDV